MTGGLCGAGMTLCRMKPGEIPVHAQSASPKISLKLIAAR